MTIRSTRAFEKKELLQWREAASYAREIYGETQYETRTPKLINFTKQQNKKIKDYILSEVNNHIHILPEVVLYFLENSFFSDICIIYDNEHNIFQPSLIDHPKTFCFDEMKKFQHKDMPTIAGDCLVIFKSGKGNYGHFLSEIAPKLFVAAKEIDLRDVTIIVPSLPDKIKKIFYTISESLERLVGYKFKYYEMASALVKLERALYVGPVSRHNKYHSPLMFDLVMHLKHSVIDSDVAKMDRIYIDRNEKYRNIKNINAVHQIFIENGFSIVRPSDYSFAEQIALFKDAKVVAGPHGAGLTNLCFLPADAKVMMIDPGLHDFFFWDISSIFKLEFNWVFCDLYMWTLDGSRADYVVDLDVLRRGIQDLLGSSEEIDVHINAETSMPTLDSIGLRFQTDKHSGLHDFLSFYDRKFKQYRMSEIVLLEIGVLAGGSLNTWREYFPNATIVGVDYDQSCLLHQTDEINVRIGNGADSDFQHKLIEEFGRPTIVIDDASHRWDHQIYTFKSLFPKLMPGGTYIIENIDTSFEGQLQKAPFQGDSIISTFDYIMKLTRVVCAETALGSEQPYDKFMSENYPWIGTVEFGRRTVAISKKHLPHGGPY